MYVGGKIFRLTHSSTYLFVAGQKGGRPARASHVVAVCKVLYDIYCNLLLMHNLHCIS